MPACLMPPTRSTARACLHPHVEGEEADDEGGPQADGVDEGDDDAVLAPAARNEEDLGG